jgi:outer membrane lipoprotein-sorting protein
MRQILGLLCFITASLTHAAIDGPTKLVLKSVSDRYEKLGNWKAKFTQESFSPGLGKGSFNEGVFFYARSANAEKFRYSLEGPEFSDFISNGREAWLAVFREGRKKAAEVKHFRSVKDVDLSRYLIFFRGLGRRSSSELEKDFKVSGKIIETVLSLTLEPKGKSDIAKLEIVFDNHVEAPKSAIITDHLGSTTTIKITSFESLSKVDTKTFEPSFPKGSKVEKL